MSKQLRVTGYAPGKKKQKQFKIAYDHNLKSLNQKTKITIIEATTAHSSH